MLEAVVESGQLNLLEYDPLYLDDSRKLQIILQTKERILKRQSIEFQATLLAQMSTAPKISADQAQKMREAAAEQSSTAYNLRFPWEDENKAAVDLETKVHENIGDANDPRYQAANEALRRIAEMPRSERERINRENKLRRAKEQRKKRLRRMS